MPQCKALPPPTARDARERQIMAESEQTLIGRSVPKAATNGRPKTAVQNRIGCHSCRWRALSNRDTVAGRIFAGDLTLEACLPLPGD